MSVFLKVKVKSLAAEARIIRREEHRWPGDSPTRASLQGHRRNDVRREARHSYLALAYLRGRAYREVEQTCHRDPDWEAVARMIKKYGPPRHNTGFDEWKQEASAA